MQERRREVRGKDELSSLLREACKTGLKTEDLAKSWSVANC